MNTAKQKSCNLRYYFTYTPTHTHGINLPVPLPIDHGQSHTHTHTHTHTGTRAQVHTRANIDPLQPRSQSHQPHAASSAAMRLLRRFRASSALPRLVRACDGPAATAPPPPCLSTVISSLSSAEEEWDDDINEQTLGAQGERRERAYVHRAYIECAQPLKFLKLHALTYKNTKAYVLVNTHTHTHTLACLETRIRAPVSPTSMWCSVLNCF